MFSCVDHTIKIREFLTLEEGYKESFASESGFPFIVRNCISFSGKDSFSGELVRSQMKKEKSLKGYSNLKTYKLSGLDALKAWDEGELHINIVDSPSTRGYKSLLPVAIESFNRSVFIDDEMWLAYVLSPINNTCGELHLDPPFGSNWQYLVEGLKTWYVVTDKSFNLTEYNNVQEELQLSIAENNKCLFDQNNDMLVLAGEPELNYTPSITGSMTPDMMLLSQSYDICAATIGPGDFISCPGWCPHSVSTAVASLGLSGYTATTAAMLMHVNEMKLIS